MVRRKLFKFAGFALACAVVFAAGSWFGTLYGQHRSHARRSAVLSAQTRELQTGAPGIRIGQPLPAVLVWAVEQDHAYEIRQLLPEGGVVLMVSTGCDVCVTAAEQMQAAIANSRGSEVRAILITKQATGARQLRETLRAQGVTLDVFCDVQESFLRAHHVTANPAFIILDSSGVVRDFGAGVPDGPRLAGESSLDQ